MLRTIFSLLLIVVLNGIHFSNCYAEEGLQVLTPKQKAKITFQAIAADKLLVSVLDHENNPIRGLQSEDFAVHADMKKTTPSFCT